jgi:hypothetical protein
VTALIIQGLLLPAALGGSKESSSPRSNVNAISPLQVFGIGVAMALAAVAAWAARRGGSAAQVDVRYPGAVIAATLLSIAGACRW